MTSLIEKMRDRAGLEPLASNPFMDLVPNEMANTYEAPAYTASAPTTTSTPTGTINWAAYVQGNPDAYADWQRYHRDMSLDAYGQYHYRADGSRRDLTPYGGTNPAAPAPTTPATPAPTTPAVKEPVAPVMRPIDPQGIAAGEPNPAAPAPTSALDFIRQTPGYQFRLDEGLKAINSNAYAKGVGNSGATYKALQQYGDNLAQGGYQQTLANYMALAEQGRGAASAVAGAGDTMGNGVSGALNNSAQAYQNNANAIAGGAIARGNATGSMWQGIAGGIGTMAGAFTGRGI